MCVVALNIFSLRSLWRSWIRQFLDLRDKCTISRLKCKHQSALLVSTASFLRGVSFSIQVTANSRCMYGEENFSKHLHHPPSWGNIVWYFPDQFWYCALLFSRPAIYFWSGGEHLSFLLRQVALRSFCHQQILSKILQQRSPGKLFVSFFENHQCKIFLLNLLFSSVSKDFAVWGFACTPSRQISRSANACRKCKIMLCHAGTPCYWPRFKLHSTPARVKCYNF